MKNLMSLRTCRPFQAVLCSLILAGLGLAPRALAQVTANPPERINYQGYLTDATGTALGLSAPKNYDLVFRIWNDAASSSTANRLWTEQQTVTVDKGNFSVLLGEGVNIGETRNSLSALSDSATASDRYLEITVKGITAGVDATLTPRLRLAPAPYAFLAAKATTAVTAGSATNVDGAGIITGTIADARLSANIPKLASPNTFTAAQTISGTLTATTLGVTGAATVGTTLGVTGATTLTGNATVGGTLGVTGATTLTGNTTVGNSTAGVLSAPYSALVNVPYIVLEENFATPASTAVQSAMLASIGGLNLRSFNTKATDTHNLCTLTTGVTMSGGRVASPSTVTGSEFTLKAGTYRCHVNVPAYAAEQHKARLYNKTAGATLINGNNTYSANTSSAQTQSVIVGQFTLGVDSVLRVEHFINYTRGDGQRIGSTFSNFALEWDANDRSVFAVAQFWKVQ